MARERFTGDCNTCDFWRRRGSRIPGKIIPGSYGKCTRPEGPCPAPVPRPGIGKSNNPRRAGTFLGYEVELTGNPKRPYKLHGPRGACYTLWRNGPRPEFLFATNGNGRVVDVAGHKWLTDRAGHLAPA